MLRAAMAAALAAACASGSPTPGGTGRSDPGHLAQALADYHAMGLLTGTTFFPVVGRILLFRGPGDSAYVGITASMSPAALRFSREEDMFAASYQVLATVVSGSDTVRRITRREIVRVDDFTETAATDERVFFQRFLKLAPGTYALDLTFRELTTRAEAERSFTLQVPRFGGPDAPMSDPVVALRATPRQAYEQSPPLIASPRSTATTSREPPLLLVESYAEAVDSLTLQVTQGDVRIWEQTLVPETQKGVEPGPRTALTTIPVARIPPGLAELTITAGDGASTRAPLLVALADDWAFAEWHHVVEHLDYALASDERAAWEKAAIGQRVELWSAFWEATDLDPTTPENEFLARYFERMSEAEDRYREPGVVGWRTGRGRAYVQLGEPDHEVVRSGSRTGQPRQIEWTYDESLPFMVHLRFIDDADFGIFRIEQRSRLVLRNAAERLRDMERSGEWTDPRDTREDEGGERP